MQVALMEGTNPQDEILVELVLLEIKRISETQGNGWILLDFPQNKNQAQLLEMRLSGYEEPKAVKQGNLKRVAGVRKSSLIAPGESHVDEKPQIKSGLDLVIMIEVSNEIAIKRSAGQRFDPIKGSKYHLEFSPPPSNIPGLNERLSSRVDDGNSAEQIQYQILSFEEQSEQLKSWFARFGNLETLANEGGIDEAASSAYEMMTDLILRKQLVDHTSIASLIAADVDEKKDADEVSLEDQIIEAAKEVAVDKASKPKPTSGKKDRGQSGAAVKPDPTPGAKGVKSGPQSPEVPEQPVPQQDSPHLSRATGLDGFKLPSKELAEILSDRKPTKFNK